MEVESSIKDLMARTLKVEPSQIHPGLKLNSGPYWDSLGHVNLMLALEKEFGIEINYETLTQLTSFKKIVAFINKPSE